MKKNRIFMVGAISLALIIASCGNKNNENSNQESNANTIAEKTVENTEKEQITQENDESTAIKVTSKGKVLCYFADPDKKNATNIRNAPNGKIVYKVDKDVRDLFTFAVVACKNNWFKIDGILESFAPEEGIENIELKGDSWVHNSVIGATFNAGADIVLREQPDMDAKIIITIPWQDVLVHFLDLHEDWVKVQFKDENSKKYEGWVLSENICANPLTTCS